MKKIISMMLVLAMILSMVPAVFAAETTELISLTNESVTTAGYTFEYTAETAGTLNVTVGTCSPGWRYRVYSPDGVESVYRTKRTAGESCDYENIAGDWKIVFYAYSAGMDDNVAGKVSFTISFTPSEGGGEIVKSEYEVSETALTLGDNTLTLLDTAVTTIYVYEPTETGVFTFTAPEGATLGYWGAGSWFLSDPGSTTNTYEWTCTGVGQSAYIGVSGVEGDFTLNVAKTGDYTVVETPIVPYENKATLEAFTIPTGAKLGQYVDVYSETVHTAVYSEEDGYYHLDSVDGDVLLVDFDYMDIVLSAALKSDRPVMYAYTTDENGNDVKYDIGNAILEYEAVMDGNGYYPVTEDVLLFYQVYAMGAGTFTFYLTGDYNEECVWMYCMRTMNMDDVVIEPSEPTNPSEPEETDPTDPSEPEETDPTDPSEPEESESTEPSESEPVDGEIVLQESVSGTSSSKYVYTYTPESDGTLSITVGDGSSNWNSDVAIMVNFAMNPIASASGSASDSYSAEVTAGTKYYVRVWTTGGAETPVTVIFQSAGGEEPSEPTDPVETDPTDPSESEPTDPSESEPTEPSEPVELPEGVLTMGTSVTASKEAPVVYTWTAEANGTLTVSMGAANPGWRYVITDAAGNTVGLAKTGSTAKSAEFTLVSGETYTFTATGYEFNTWAETEADITYTLSFAPDEQQGGEVEKTAYEVSDTELVVGENKLTMLDTAVTTIFKFKPTEAGTYTITAPEGATAGNWGSNANYLNDPSSTTNTCQWTCSSVGQSVFIGVSGIEGDFVLTVVKEVEETEPSEPETDPSEPEETDPTDPSESEPSEPETETTIPSVPDEPAPEDAVFAVIENGEYTYYSTGSDITTVLSNAAAGQTVILYADIDLGTSAITIGGNAVLDLNGHILTSKVSNGAVISVTGTFTVQDSSAEADGLLQNTSNYGIKLDDTSAVVTLLSGNVSGTVQAVRVNAGTFNGKGGALTTAGNYGVYVANGAFANLSGTNVTVTGSWPYAVSSFSGTTTISGGYFVGQVYGAGLNGNVSGGYFNTRPNDAYIASGCELQDNDDAVYLYKVVDPNAVEPEEPKTPVAMVGETEYYSVADAIAAAQGSFVKLVADVTEDITVSADLYLDLNGYSISGAVTVAEGATLYGMDSTTDDYDCADGYGKITGTVTGNVASNFKSDITGAIMRYVAITEETGISFHRIYVGVTKMSLKPGSVALGYRAVFAADDVVKAALAETGAFGIKVWVDGFEENAIVLSMDAADFVSGKALTARVQEIDVENYGDTAICAEAFLTIGEETITSSTVSGSLKYMLETVNEKIDSYTAAQKTALAALVEQYYAVMKDWNVSNIYCVPDVDTPVEGSDPVE